MTHPLDIVAAVTATPEIDGWRARMGGQAVDVTFEPNGRLHLSVVRLAPNHQVLAQRNMNAKRGVAPFGTVLDAITTGIAPLRLQGATLRAVAAPSSPIESTLPDPTPLLREISLHLEIDGGIDLAGARIQMEFEAFGASHTAEQSVIRFSLVDLDTWTRLPILVGSTPFQSFLRWASAAWPWIAPFDILRGYGPLAPPTAHERMSFHAALKPPPAAERTPRAISIREERLIIGY